MTLPTERPIPSAATPPIAWHDIRRTADIDEHAQLQMQWAMQYDQLSAGVFSGALNHLQLPGMRLVHETANCAMRQRGHLGQGLYGFAMTLDQPGEAYYHGQRHDSESIILGHGDEFDLTSPARFSMVGIVVDGPLLSSMWEQMYQTPLASWFAQQLVVQARPHMAPRLRATHLALLEHVRSTPALLLHSTQLLQMRDELLIEWIESIPNAVDTQGCKSVAARQRMVNRACDLMLSQPEQTTTIVQLCAQIGATPRKLEYCFRDILGISPAKYLRAVRINGVRRDIKRINDAQCGVQDIAARWGFWHLGDFSAHYKQQFGELPSETLRRVRGQPAASHAPGH